MNMEAIRRPTVSTFEGSDAFAGVPEIADIHFDLWVLRIALSFRDIDDTVHVSFEGVRGFRVLDEGDLLEFWEPDARASGWLWRVKDGGWFALESTRQGFVSGITDCYKEYLVVGVNDCVSVISTNEPKIEAPKP